jgi:hypothetical protein
LKNETIKAVKRLTSVNFITEMTWSAEQQGYRLYTSKGIAGYGPHPISPVPSDSGALKVL